MGLDNDTRYIYDGKIRKLTQLMCQWNRHLWAGKEKELLHNIWNLFREECLEEWNKKELRKKKK